MSNTQNLPFNYKIVLKGTGNTIKTQMNLQDLYSGSDRQFTRGFLSVQSAHIRNNEMDGTSPVPWTNSKIIYLTSDLYFSNSYLYDSSNPTQQAKSNILFQIPVNVDANAFDAFEKCLSWKSEGVYMNYLPRFLDLNFTMADYDLTPETQICKSMNEFTIILSLDLFE